MFYEVLGYVVIGLAIIFFLLRIYDMKKLNKLRSEYDRSKDPSRDGTGDPKFKGSQPITTDFPKSEGSGVPLVPTA